MFKTTCLILFLLPLLTVSTSIEVDGNGNTMDQQRRTGGGIGSHHNRANNKQKRRKKRKRPRLPPKIRKIVKAKNKKAISLAKANDLRGAAKMFEEVVDLSPNDSQYLNNLAVTYMRLKLYHLAEQILRRARKANRDDPDPLKNLKDLRDYLPDSLPHPNHLPQLHTVRKFVRVPYKDFHLEKYKNYRNGNLPYVLTGAMDHWNFAFDNWSLEYFMKKYPEARVEHYSRNMVQETVKPTFQDIKLAYNDMTAKSKWYKDKPGVYVQWNMNVKLWNEILLDAMSGSGSSSGSGDDGDDGDDDDRNEEREDEDEDEDDEDDEEEQEKEQNKFPDISKITKLSNLPKNMQLPSVFTLDDVWFDECFDGKEDIINNFMIGTHWRMLLIGSDGAGMFNHRDILRSSSFQAQIVGTKRWHLCGPSEDQYMYKAGDINTFNPNYTEFPKMKDANCFDDWVSPGEMMFYGRDWWHHTEVLSDSKDGRPSISITGTLTDQNNYKSMITELSRECGLDLPDGTSTSNLGKRIHIGSNVCSNIQKCFDKWETDWGSIENNYDLLNGKSDKFEKLSKQYPKLDELVEEAEDDDWGNIDPEDGDEWE